MSPFHCLMGRGCAFTKTLGPRLQLWFPTCWVSPDIRSVLSHCLFPMTHWLFPSPSPPPPRPLRSLRMIHRVWNNCLRRFFPMPGVSSTHLQRIAICSWMRVLIVPEMMILCAADQRRHVHRGCTAKQDIQLRRFRGPFYIFLLKMKGTPLPQEGGPSVHEQG